MVFDMIPQSPLFSNYDSKSIIFYDELNNYERKIRLIQNEFAGALKQDQAVELLAWIANKAKRDEN